MRAQREEITLLKQGSADPKDIQNAMSRYQGSSAEYTGLSKAMGLPQQRERVTLDGLGKVGGGKVTKITDAIKPVIKAPTISIPKVVAKPIVQTPRPTIAPAASKRNVLLDKYAEAYMQDLKARTPGMSFLSNPKNFIADKYANKSTKQIQADLSKIERRIERRKKKKT